MAAAELAGGWHRVCLNTIVRKGVALDSERLRILPMGSRVHVVEKAERRVRIDQPIAGWCSLKSSNGDTILTPLDQEEVSIATPAASASNFQAQQEKWTQRHENYKQQYSAVEQKQQAVQRQIDDAVSNSEIQQIANQLNTLKSKVEEHQAAKQQRKAAAAELSATQNAIEEINTSSNLTDTEISQLQETMESLKSELHTKALEAGVADPAELAREIDALEAEKKRYLEKVAQADALAQAAKNEMELMKQQMTTMFGANAFNNGPAQQDPALDYEDGDVVLGKQGLGIVVVRWIGEYEGEMCLGVELSDPIQQGTNGAPHFSCEAGKGLFIPVDQVKKKLTPETLLNQLHEVLKQVTRTRQGASE